MMKNEQGNIIFIILIVSALVGIFTLGIFLIYPQIKQHSSPTPTDNPIDSSSPSPFSSLSPSLGGTKRTSPTPRATGSSNKTPDPSLPSDQFGVSFSSNQYRPDALTALDIAHQYNISWVRLNLTWAVIEPSQGNFDWSRTDALVNRLQTNHEHALAMLSFSTSWDNSAPSSVSSEGVREHYPPSDLQPWVQYVTDTVNRYKNTIQYWEVWNEPDLQGYWEGSPSEYASLLSATYNAIKQADPAAKVVLGGLSLGGSPGSLDSNFFDEILSDKAYPATRSFDIANFHQYGSLTEATNRFTYVKNELSKYGIGNKPIWVTEVGVTSHYNSNAQTQYMQQILPALLNLGVEKVFWFELYDSNMFASFFGPYQSDAEIIQQLKNMGLYNSYVTFKTTGVLDDNLRSAMEKYGIDPNAVTSPNAYNINFIEYGLIDENLNPKISLSSYKNLIQTTK